MAEPDEDAAKPRTRENDNARVEGGEVRPATEPEGAKASQLNDKTLTDPGTGAPTRPN